MVMNNPVLDQLLTDKYDHFTEVAERVLGKKKWLIDLRNRARMMVTDAYLHCSKLDSTDPSFLESCMVRTIQYQTIWKKTAPFLKEQSHAQEYIFDDSDRERNPSDYTDPEPDAYTELCEQRLRNLKIKLKTLDYKGRYIYDNIISQGKSARHLSEMTGIPHTAAYYLIRDLKKYLRDGDYDN